MSHSSQTPEQPAMRGNSRPDAGPRLRYVLCETMDPEERLEDAALWKALHDHYGDDIEAVGAAIDDGVPWFGRSGRHKQNSGQIGSHRLAYWTDPAFLNNCGREFVTLPFEVVGDEVDRLHAAGKGAFLKSTLEKHCIVRAPVGSDWEREVGDMAYSFIDGGPALMVQELAEITEEFRFFVIGREVVTWSENRPELTPIARSAEPPPAFADLAAVMAQTMETDEAVVDIGWINGRPGVVEFNPMVLGGIGLFACDVGALARASERMLPTDGASPSVSESTDADRAPGLASNPLPKGSR